LTLSVGDELPRLVKNATTRQLVRYSAAQGDFFEIHYDSEFARSVGLPGVIVQGLLKAAFLGQMVTDWLGDRGVLRTLEVSYRGVDVPGPYLCGGQIVRVDDLELAIQLWGESSDGHRTAVGEATVHMFV
jgi:acyl dehydratase